ncbi:MAG: hypothetical protein ACJ788_11200 [Ktedonobacteraceae bacterium]
MNNQQTMSSALPLNGTSPNAGGWRSIPSKLQGVDDGEVVERLLLLRKECISKSPQEIHLLLNPTEIGEAAEAQFSKGVRVIEGIRNLFLLLPLMVTWLSFSLASTAFTQSKIIGKSFFDLWTSGFPDIQTLIVTIGALHISLPLAIGTWHWFSFPDVALTDFILLSCVLIFSQLAYSIENSARREAMGLSTWLREEVQQLCDKSLVRPIGTGPDSEQPMWAVQVHSAINSLLTVLETVKTTVGNSQHDFSDTINKFSDTYKQQSNFVDNLIQNTRDIEVAITHLNTLFSDDTYKRLEAILPRIEVQFDKMAMQQELATQALESIASDIKGASMAIVRLAKPFEAVGFAEMMKQREYVEQANAALLGQIQSDLKHYASSGTRNPSGPTLRQKIVRFFKRN